MATETLAQVLLRMVQDDSFAKAVLDDPKKALQPYKGTLTDEEYSALSTPIDPKTVEPLHAVPRVGAWKLLGGQVHTLPDKVRADLNEALARRSMPRTAIPCTGD